MSRYDLKAGHFVPYPCSTQARITVRDITFILTTGALPAKRTKCQHLSYSISVVKLFAQCLSTPYILHADQPMQYTHGRVR